MEEDMEEEPHGHSGKTETGDMPRSRRRGQKNTGEPSGNEAHSSSEEMDVENERKMKLEATQSGVNELSVPEKSTSVRAWLPGDVAWARVGGHPFWPCILTYDPEQKDFTRLSLHGTTVTRSLHVQFFADNGRRSWLTTNCVIPFEGVVALNKLQQKLQKEVKKTDKLLSAFNVRSSAKDVWDDAVREADLALKKPRAERLLDFNKQFPIILRADKTAKEKRDASQEIVRPRMRRKYSHETTSVQNKKEPDARPPVSLNKATKSNRPSATTSGIRKKDYRKKKISPCDINKKDKRREKALIYKLKNRIASDFPVMDKKTIRKYLESNWKYMSKTQKAKFFLRFAEDSDTCGDKEKNNAESSYEESTEARESSPAPPRSPNSILQKRGGLFRSTEQGATEERNDAESNYIESTEARKSSTAPLRSPNSIPSNSGSLFCGTEPGPSKLTKNRAESTYKESTKTSPVPLRSANFILRKSGGLFLGTKQEKVCQICEKPGNTVKCKGPCSGFYHVDCLSENGKNKVSPRKNKKARPRSSKVPIIEDKESHNQKKTGLTTDTGRVRSKILSKENWKFVKNPTGMANAEAKKEEKYETNTEEFHCKRCQAGILPACFVCGKDMEENTSEEKHCHCIVGHCGKYFHVDCLKLWPQAWTGGNRTPRRRISGANHEENDTTVTCPQHVCHTCASDDPRNVNTRFTNDRLVRCIRCPTAYHYGNYCLPAGSDVLTGSQILCPRHCELPRRKTCSANVSWCSICSIGGSLICCDFCPNSFHGECLNIPPPEGSYMCEDCETGRYPLYGEIVWVKLASYRWWPAQILFPNQIPDNISGMRHLRGEFAVKFFGSHDHCWTNRGRVFLYQEGDTGTKYRGKSSVDTAFARALQEAAEAHKALKDEKANWDAETRPDLKPPLYVKIKSNKPVGNVRLMERDPASMTPCNCDPKSENPCGPDSDCLNRFLMVECNPSVCMAGERCGNQCFVKRLYPPLVPFWTDCRGWGLKTLANLKKGDFVIEYVGEIIDEREFQSRLNKKNEEKDENYYFLFVEKDRILDADSKGNVARFVNHSCQPNCETQKWTVNGDTRVGLFALEEILLNSELTFNYNWDCVQTKRRPCMCGAANCSGFIGLKATKGLVQYGKTNKQEIKKK